MNRAHRCSTTATWNVVAGSEPVLITVGYKVAVNGTQNCTTPRSRRRYGAIGEGGQRPAVQGCSLWLAFDGDEIVERTAVHGNQLGKGGEPDLCRVTALQPTQLITIQTTTTRDLDKGHRVAELSKLQAQPDSIDLGNHWLILHLAPPIGRSHRTAFGALPERGHHQLHQ